MKSVLAFVVVIATISGCASREEKVERLQQRKNVIFLELRELAGYTAMKDELAGELRTAPTKMDRLTRSMNPGAADYFAQKDAQEEADLSGAIDLKVREVCLGYGKQLEDGGKEMITKDEPSAFKTFFDAPKTADTCRDAWKAELAIRELLKG